MNGVIVINKPKNFTSFDVVAIMRKLCGIKKVGHAGTLDPMATGVLPILLGKATKIQGLLQNSDKSYIAKIRFGITTDTDDITGNIISKKQVNIKKSTIESVLNSFKGKISQTPPMYSAIKKDGVRLYTLARKGIYLDVEPREITINELNLLSFNGEIAEIFVKCSKGTYIRSLCRDIGEKIGCGATLLELKRTSACSFSIEESISLDESKELSKNNILQSKVISIEDIFKKCQGVFLTLAQTKRFNNGGSILVNRTGIEKASCLEVFRVYSEENVFLGLAQIDKEKESLCRIFSAI